MSKGGWGVDGRGKGRGGKWWDGGVRYMVGLVGDGVGGGRIEGRNRGARYRDGKRLEGIRTEKGGVIIVTVERGFGWETGEKCGVWREEGGNGWR